MKEAHQLSPEAMKRNGAIEMPAGVIIILVGWITGIAYTILFLIGVILIADGARRILKSRKTRTTKP